MALRSNASETSREVMKHGVAQQRQ